MITKFLKWASAVYRKLLFCLTGLMVIAIRYLLGPGKSTTVKGGTSTEKTIVVKKGGIPVLITICVLIWAQRNGLFENTPGINSFVNLIIKLFDELYKFITEFMIKLASDINLEESWTEFKDWVLN